MAEQPSTEVLAAGRFLSLLRRGRWEFAHRTNCNHAVAIVAVTDDARLVLVEQFREPVGRRVIELPAGLVGDDGASDEAALAAAQRELLEETGWTARSWRLLTEGPPTAGLASERVSFFLARELARAGDGGGVEHEQITVHAPRLAQIDDWLADRGREGLLVDPKVYAGLYFVLRDAAPTG